MSPKAAWVLAAACPAVAILIALFVHREPEPLAIQLISAPHLELTGTPDSHSPAVFRFKNISGAVVKPTVIWTNCGCNQFSITPETVEPGGEFLLTAEAVVPLYGKETTRAYRIGTPGSPRSRSVYVSARASNDDRSSLMLAPTFTRVKLDEEGRASVTLDIAYVSRLASGDPVTDLEAGVEGGTTEIVTVETIRSRQHPGEFSGQIRVDLKVEGALVGKRKLVLECPGAPSRSVDVTLQ